MPQSATFPPTPGNTHHQMPPEQVRQAWNCALISLLSLRQLTRPAPFQEGTSLESSACPVAIGAPFTTSVQTPLPDEGA